MRILSVYYTHKPGGFCKRLYRLLNALAVKGHDVHYLTLDAPPQGALSTAVCLHIIPFPLRIRRGLLFWGIFCAATPLFIFAHTLRLKIDRIVVFGAFYSALCCLTRSLGVPTVLFLRSLVFRIDEITGKPWLIRKVAALVDRQGMRRARRVICMTEAMKREAERFLGCPLSDVHILSNDLSQAADLEAASTNAPPSGPAPRFTIVAAGVLDQRKNISALLQAMRKLPGELRSQTRLIVLGEGPLRSVLEREAQAAKLEQVRFAGWVPSLAPYLSQCHLLVHPALHEGVPNVITEALAAGRPVIASDIPEHRELLQDERLLFSLERPEALAQRLAEILQNEAAYTAIQKAARVVATRLRFDWDELAVALVTTPTG